MKHDLGFGLVSVVIPTYKRFEQTVRAVDSCLNQTYRNIQIIIVDDGSGGDSFESLTKHYKGESRTEFYKVEHSGNPGKVRNAGLSHADGEWIAFLDSDDYWLENKLLSQLEQAASTGYAAICTNGISSHNNEVLIKGKIPQKITLQNLVKRNYIINSSVLLRRELLLTIGGVVDQSSALGAEDFATWLRVAVHQDWLFLNIPMVGYESASPDSMKFSRNVSQIFAIQYGLLNFAEWLIRENILRIRLSRFFLLAFRHVLILDFLVTRSIPRYKKSNHLE